MLCMNTLVGVCLVAVAVVACGNEPQEPNGQSVTYLGDFECTEIDADRAILMWNQEASTGQFGWVPSNSGSDQYVVQAISSLMFEVQFTDLLGVDEPGQAETVTVKFDLLLSDDRKRVSGAGTLTRALGTVETCTADLATPG
jgi:hypothetical protein